MVAVVKAVVVARALPPLEAEYHWSAVPVADKFAIVGLLIVQKLCEAVPVGARGLLIVTATAKRVALSQLPIV